MAEEAAKKPAAKPAEKSEEKKPKDGKTKPTNCVQCNVRIRRKTWYYRYGQYFCGQKCASTFWAKKQEAKTKSETAASETPAA